MKEKLTAKHANNTGFILVVIPAGQLTLMIAGASGDTTIEWDDTILRFDEFRLIPKKLLFMAHFIIDTDTGEVFKSKYGRFGLPLLDERGPAPKRGELQIFSTGEKNK